MLSIARILFIAAFGLLVSACAGLPQPPESAHAAVAKPRAADAGDLPGAVLDGDTLYRLLIGEIAGQRGQVEIAAEALGRVARDTRDPRLAERATLAALYAKRHDEALKNAQLWVQLRPAQIEAREAMAVALLGLGRTADAQQELDRILAAEERENRLDQACMRAAAVLGRHADRAAALEVMSALVQSRPQVAGAHFAHAHLLVRSGDLDKGLIAAETALALRPGWDEAALFKARILVSQKEALRAEAFFVSYLDARPGAIGMRLSYARHLIDQKQWEKARAQFERVVRDAPEDAEAVYALGLLSLQTSRPEEAERYLRRTLELQPDNDTARLYLGQVAESRKRYEEAAQWYRDIDEGENFFEAQVRLGAVLAKLGGLDAARALLHGIATEGEAQRAQLVLVEEQILREARRYSEAFEVLTRALRDLPGNNEILYARALAAEKLNRLDVMEKDLRLVISRDPKNAHAFNALGYTLADRTSRLKEAEELLSQAQALRPDDPFILDSLGWLYYRLGNVAEAARYLKRALELRPDAEIAAHLGEVLWVSGNRGEAENVWNRALRETPDNDALLDAIKKFKP